MNTLPVSRPPVKANRKPLVRTAHLHTVGGGRVLGLTVGTDTMFYRLTALASDFGRAFRLAKADRGDGPGEQYDVCLNGQRSTCECKGFLRHSHCKHLESLTALSAAGQLPAALPALDQQDRDALADGEARSLDCPLDDL